MTKPASIPTDPAPLHDRDGNADKPTREHTDPHDQEHARKVAEEKAHQRVGGDNAGHQDGQRNPAHPNHPG